MANGKVALYVGIIGVLLLAASSASAESIDTLSTWQSGNFIDGFGEFNGGNPGAVTFGQTFKISAGNAQLKSITFKTIGKTEDLASQVCKFQTGVMAWDGSRPTGPTLYMSNYLTTSAGWYPTDTFTVPLGNTAVRSGMEYIVFFTANNYLDGIQNDAMMAITSNNSYADGMFMVNYGGTNFADLKTGNWWGVPANDLAMNLEYQIPEPASLLLLGLGGLVLRRRAQD